MLDAAIILLGSGYYWEVIE